MGSRVSFASAQTSIRQGHGLIREDCAPITEWLIGAAIDRLVYHATILEMNVDSYRRKEGVDKAWGAGRPPTRATIKTSS
jgi:hypothetical protein